MSTVKPKYNGVMDPVYPCRNMPTRHCPASYNGVCGEDRVCARFESQDPAPWSPELEGPHFFLVDSEGYSWFIGEDEKEDVTVHCPQCSEVIKFPGDPTAGDMQTGVNEHTKEKHPQ